MALDPQDRNPLPADPAWSRGAALAIIAVIVLLLGVAAFGWSHYRGADPGDPRVEMLPSTPTSVDRAGASAP